MWISDSSLPVRDALVHTPRKRRERPAWLTELDLQYLAGQRRTEVQVVTDGTVPGLAIRFLPSGLGAWTLALRVAGEGGVNKFGKRLLGKKIRVTIGHYPTASLYAARAQASSLIEHAKNGINPRQFLRSASLTVEALSKEFIRDYVHSAQLESAANYEMAFALHINPKVGRRLADRLTRSEIRDVMNAARVKRKRPDGRAGAPTGGIEAARTTMSVLRQMFTWGIDEGFLKRKDNPCSKITNNLPRRVTRDRVLSLQEARIVWLAAELTGYPFGTHVQLMLLTGCRLSEWAHARVSWIDMSEALMTIPANKYKSRHVHVVPLVPQAIEILERLPPARRGKYLLSSDYGATPIVGVSKFYRTRLADAIMIANAGARLPRTFTSQDLRRTVATRLAEMLGEQGEKLVPRVLGHADGSVTAIYNRYAYVREMRAALERWAAELTQVASDVQ